MNKVFAVVDCSVPINTRNQKIIDSIYKEFPEAIVHVITWNRDGGQCRLGSFYHTYDKVAPPADVWAKLKGMYAFKKHIGKVLDEINPNVIIASHWSNLILVSGFKKVGQTLIYENLDIPTGGTLVRRISSKLESIALRKVDLIVHASRFFKPLYNQSIPQFILENKPAFGPNRKIESIGKPLKVAFIGSIRYKEILMNLVDALKNDSKYELYFHGSGEDYQAMLDYCKEINNVYFTGKYNYSNVVKLYHQSDIIWAGYPNKDYNVIYAISNKFHESLYVGVPCVYSDKTKLAAHVQKENIGFVVDPYNPIAIKKLFDEIAYGQIDITKTRESMIDYLLNESSWNDDFKGILNYI